MTLEEMKKDLGKKNESLNEAKQWVIYWSARVATREKLCQDALAQIATEEARIEAERLRQEAEKKAVEEAQAKAEAEEKNRRRSSHRERGEVLNGNHLRVLAQACSIEGYTTMRNAAVIITNLAELGLVEIHKIKNWQVFGAATAKGREVYAQYLAWIAEGKIPDPTRRTAQNNAYRARKLLRDRYVFPTCQELKAYAGAPLKAWVYGICANDETPDYVYALLSWIHLHAPFSEILTQVPQSPKVLGIDTWVLSWAEENGVLARRASRERMQFTLEGKSWEETVMAEVAPNMVLIFDRNSEVNAVRRLARKQGTPAFELGEKV